MGERQIPAIGVQDFEKVRKGNIFYIDKTAFIREWWESGDDVTLITRPRRFGKTLNMSTLECFFSVKYAGREDLFEGLSIWKEEKYRKLQGKFPVIALSFANVKGSDFNVVREMIFRMLSELYIRYSFLQDSGKLNEAERVAFYEIASANGRLNASQAVTAIQRLSCYLEKYYGVKPLIFLDEYDTPMQEAYVYGYWDEMTDLIQNMFNSTFKTNPSMGRAIMTGITRVSKESVFSDLNNLKIVTTTSEQYMTSFGFTEKEVFAVLDDYGLGSEKELVKRWYDGFIFGTTRDIYNPWSILNFVAEKKLKAYWANTSSNSLVGKLIQEGAPEIKKDMETLLKGGTITAHIDEQIVFHQLQGNKEAVWSLFVASGYLKVEQYVLNPEEGDCDYTLSLTNFEVRTMFRRMIEGWFKDAGIGYNDFIRALLAGDVEEMNAYMNKIALESFSSFDTGVRSSEYAEPERFYHGFVLGLIVELRDRYDITSNRESGFGRYDVMMEPLPAYQNELAPIIIEFKVYNGKKEKGLDDTLQAALTQIQEKNYDAGLVAKGFSKEGIRHYGFAFQGKTVLIG
ncbi:MAG: ATP-binding protein [Butyrivibrio sp.]|nr:ATP-binding protein [Muribaculum sp.]MCM1551848.1 ATP-binding protein [Butyrivibrio sp.]